MSGREGTIVCLKPDYHYMSANISLYHTLSRGFLLSKSGLMCLSGPGIDCKVLYIGLKFNSYH